MSKPQSDIQRLTDYLMEHSPCTCAEMSAALGLHSVSISNILSRLKCRGMAQQLTIKGQSRYWEMAPGYEELSAYPVRQAVKVWAPHHDRHWLDVAFFGAAPAQVAA